MSIQINSNKFKQEHQYKHKLQSSAINLSVRRSKKRDRKIQLERANFNQATKKEFNDKQIISFKTFSSSSSSSSSPFSSSSLSSNFFIVNLLSLNDETKKQVNKIEPFKRQIQKIDELIISNSNNNDDDNFNRNQYNYSKNINKQEKEEEEGKKERTRKNRTLFSKWQLDSLEFRFNKNKYLNTSDRLRVAKSLDLDQVQIKTWFQVSTQTISCSLHLK